MPLNKKAQTKDWAQFNNHEAIVMVVIFRLIPPDLTYKLCAAVLIQQQIGKERIMRALLAMLAGAKPTVYANLGHGIAQPRPILPFEVRQDPSTSPEPCPRR